MVNKPKATTKALKAGQALKAKARDNTPAQAPAPAPRADRDHLKAFSEAPKVVELEGPNGIKYLRLKAALDRTISGWQEKEYSDLRGPGAYPDTFLVGRWSHYTEAEVMAIYTHGQSTYGKGSGQWTIGGVKKLGYYIKVN